MTSSDAGVRLALNERAALQDSRRFLAEPNDVSAFAPWVDSAVPLMLQDAASNSRPTGAWGEMQ
jgi:hypothetical protein